MWLIWIVFEWAQNFSYLFGGSLSQRAAEPTRVTRWRKQRRTNYIKNAKIHKFMTCRQGPSFCDPSRPLPWYPTPIPTPLQLLCCSFCCYMAFLLAKQNGAWQESQMGLQAPHSQNLPPSKRLELIIHAMSLAASAKGTGKDPF